MSIALDEERPPWLYTAAGAFWRAQAELPGVAEELRPLVEQHREHLRSVIREERRRLRGLRSRAEAGRDAP